MEHRIKTIFFCTLMTLAGCAPISDTDPPTGNAVGTAIGGVAGASVAAIAGASKPTIAVAGIGGAALGYYMTTLRFTSSGITAVGGKVYALGRYIIIDLPTDSLFDPNTADLLPGSDAILDSVVAVLKRSTGNNIFISGNTSGSWTARFERKMSECRAAQVASYLWAHGITNSAHFKNDTNEKSKARDFIYIGYGDTFPIGNQFHMKGIRANSRIQIVSSPSQEELHWDRQHNHFKKYANIGDPSEDNKVKDPEADNFSKYAYAFSDDHMPDGTNLGPTNQSGNLPITVPTIEGNAAPTTHQPTDTLSEGYSPSVAINEPQTSSGVSVVKHGGYKGEEDFKGEGSPLPG